MGGNTLDVAVVGGGVSGVYTAWRLLTAPNPPRVGLFEASSRVGGRIDTVGLPVPGFDSAVEMGAMRFIPSMQIVANLLKYLGIPTELFPCNKVSGTFARNTFLKTDSNGNVTNLPYQLAPGEPPNSGLLLLKVLDQAVPGALKLTEAEWRKVARSATFRGRLLNQWAMRNVAEEILSNEACDYVMDTAGLDAMLEWANAIAGIHGIASIVSDFAQAQVYRPVEGFRSLVAGLMQRLSTAPEFSFHPDHKLQGISPGSNGLTLTFSHSGTASSGAHEKIEARKVVLAMPKRPLELLNLDGLFESNQECEEFYRKLDTVEDIAAFKLGLLYDEPWWQKMGDAQNVEPGSYRLTDLPLRQVFFGAGVGPNQQDNERVLIGTYCDTGSARYWQGLMDRSQCTPVKTPDAEYCRVSPGVLLAAVDRQMMKITGRASPLPAPRFAAIMDWNGAVSTAGWHEWKPRVDITDTIPQLRNPLQGFPVYVCGEAYSWLQSWIEGALLSAERMLQDHFHLPWPSEWLPTSYDIGP